MDNAFQVGCRDAFNPHVDRKAAGVGHGILGATRALGTSISRDGVGFRAVSLQEGRSGGWWNGPYREAFVAF